MLEATGLQAHPDVMIPTEHIPGTAAATAMLVVAVLTLGAAAILTLGAAVIGGMWGLSEAATWAGRLLN
jgi:hypothetical protein